ncbi:MAG: hypothetical protein ACYCS7_13375 [Acidimicrobiales bacterium]
MRATRGAGLLQPHHLDQVRAKRAAACQLLGAGEPATTRVAGAPPAYLLAHESSDIARQCRLLTPSPASGSVRVAVTPGWGPTKWHLDVGCRDQPGLLAAFTGVLTGYGLDITQAVIATWEDGTALQAFILQSAIPPSPARLQAGFQASLARPLPAGSLPETTVDFDDHASALYTACVVRVTDRPGLLHAIALGIAAVGVDIHAARITTTDGQAIDYFDLSDNRGGKLDTTLKEAVRWSLRADTRGPAPLARRSGTAGNSVMTARQVRR